MELRDAHVLVTGASRGLGLAIARVCAQRGARLTLVARDSPRLASAAEELGGVAVAVDLSRPSVEAIEGAEQAHGPVDVLVNNAGINQAQLLRDLDEATLRAQLHTNLVTPLELTRRVLPGMLERDRGAVVNISSIAGDVAMRNQVGYCATKAGLSHATRAIQREVRGTEVQVIPPMHGAPVEHFQVTVDLTGPCTIKDKQTTLNATGIRDLFATFEDFSITAMRFFAEDVPERTDGFVLRDGEWTSVKTIGVVRDASGLCAEAIFGLDTQSTSSTGTGGGEELRLRSLGRRGGFWIPMSWERQGPTMSAYDEFCGFRLPDGREGMGVAEHGTVRHLY